MKNQYSEFHKGLIQVADPKIWVASVIPLAAGASLAWCFGTHTKPLSWIWFTLAVIGVFLVEIAKNALNELIDYQSGADPGIDEEHRTPFSGGKKSVVDGRLDLTQCAYIAFVCFALAAVIGIALVLFVEVKVFWIGLAGFVLAIMYSLPPFKLCYRGFGEIAVGLAFGPIVVLGVYVLFEGRFDWLALLVSVPIAFLIADVLVINQFPDYEVDKRCNKKNWVVRLGKERSVWLFAALLTLAYIAQIGIAVYAENFIWLLPLLTMPIAVKAVKNCRENHNNIRLLIASNAAMVRIYQLFGISFVVCALLDGLAF